MPRVSAAAALPSLSLERVSVCIFVPIKQVIRCRMRPAYQQHLATALPSLALHAQLLATRIEMRDALGMPATVTVRAHMHPVLKAAFVCSAPLRRPPCKSQLFS